MQVFKIKQRIDATTPRRKRQNHSRPASPNRGVGEGVTF